mmetsp:Transcript_15473/g.48642  ORF Transcript_15473/g.48642 Transcript_15473/m.48642 type:complete len:216 (-) Transcript_15473:104-751(-)
MTLNVLGLQLYVSPARPGKEAIKQEQAQAQTKPKQVHADAGGADQTSGRRGRGDADDSLGLFSRQSLAEHPPLCTLRRRSVAGLRREERVPVVVLLRKTLVLLAVPLGDLLFDAPRPGSPHGSVEDPLGRHRTIAPGVRVVEKPLGHALAPAVASVPSTTILQDSLANVLAVGTVQTGAKSTDRQAYRRSRFGRGEVYGCSGPTDVRVQVLVAAG